MAKHSSLFRTIAIIVTTTTLTLSVAGAAIAVHALKKDLPNSQIPGGEGQQGQTLKSIDKVEKTNTYGLIDEYTIYYTDGTSSIFIVTNGSDGQPGAQGFPGADGVTPTITIENGKWVINGTVTDLDAVGPQGPQGPTGQAGETPHIGANGNWWIGETDTGVNAQGQTPTIGENGNWFIGGVDTGVSANGQAGRSIVSVDKTDSQGLIDVYTITYSDNTTSTFLVTNGENGAQGQGIPGQDGHTPEITVGENGNWFVDGVDTGTHAQGPQGPTGQAGYSVHTGEGVPAANLGQNGDSYINLLSWDYYVMDSGVWVKIGNIAGQDGISVSAGNGNPTTSGATGNPGDTYIDLSTGDIYHMGENGEWGTPEANSSFALPHIGANGNWFIGDTDTGVAATGPAGQAGVSPHIGANGNWFIGETDTGVKAQGANGQNGTSVSAGNGDPTTGNVQGNPGDTYIDLSTGNVYQMGDNGEWGTPIDNSGVAVPHIGANGNWFIGENDTGVKAQGPAGQDGTSILTGSGDPTTGNVPGNAGDTYIDLSTGDVYHMGDNGEWGTPDSTSNFAIPHIGANGHWYVGETDTGVNATGPQGPAGASVSLNHGDPTTNSVEGKQGDTYIDLDTGYLYTYDETNGWVKSGEGAAATSVLTGNGEPAATTGKNGDSYINLANWDFYVKEDGAWNLAGNIKGADGATGAQGASVNVGHGDPTTGNVQGKVGDTYIDLDTGNYYTMTNEGWGEPAGGGAIGASLRYGTTAPDNSLGNNGDSYINTETWDYYAKENGTWVHKGNFAGQNGTNGVSISSVVKTGTEGLVDTYTITYSDNTSTNPHVDTFTVTNGQDGNKIIVGTGAPTDATLANVGDNYIDVETWKLYVKADDGWTDKGSFKGDAGEDGVSIVSVTLKETNDLIDVYEITYSDSTTANPHVDTFTVTNGKDGTSVRTGHRDPRAVQDDPVTPQDETLAAVAGIEGDSYIDLDTWNYYVLTDDGEGNLVWNPEGNLHYSPNKYTVTFDSDGGTAVASYEEALEGFTIVNPTAPTKDDYFFQGWYTSEGTRWDFSKDVVTKDITLTARWGQFVVEDGIITDCSITSGDIVIPEFYNDQLIIGIGDEVFKDQTGITSFTLPHTVKSIGNSAFEGCTGLTSVVIPSNVKSIGQNAFKDCSNVVYVYIEEGAANPGISGFRKIAPTQGLEAIGAGAFANCSSLKGIILPSTIKSIGKGAFEDCDSLESYTAPFIGGSVEASVSWAYCYGAGEPTTTNPLNNVYLDTESGYIWVKANGAWNKTEMAIPPSMLVNGAPTGSANNGDVVMDIDTGNLYGYQNDTWNFYMNLIDNPQMATVLSNYVTDATYLSFVFGGDSYDDNDFTLPSSLKTITITGDYAIDANAMNGCDGIETIIISGNPSSIGFGAFAECDDLKSITLPYIGPDSGYIAPLTYSYGNGEPNTVNPTTTTYFDLATKHYWQFTNGQWLDLTEDKNDATLDAIASGTGVVIGTEFPSSGSFLNYETGVLYTYYNENWVPFSNLLEFANPLPESNYYLGYIFGANNRENQSSSIPSYLDTIILTGANGDNRDCIPSYAFFGCDAKNIVLPNNVRDIGDYAFGETEMTSFVVPNSVEYLGKGVFKGSDISELTLPFLGKNRDTLSVADATLDYLFDNHSNNVETVILTGGNGVNRDTIPDFAFASNTHLKNVILCEGITKIGAEAFHFCTTLTSVKLPSTLKVIGKACFYQTTQLTELNLPQGLTRIEAGALADTRCSTIVIPSSVTFIGERAFHDNRHLKSVVFQDGMNKQFGENVFLNCDALENVYLGHGITKVNTKMFADLKSLKVVALAETITEIEDLAFKNCTSLKAINLPANLKSIGIQAFYHCTGLESFVMPNSVTSVGRMAFEGCISLKYLTLSENLAKIEVQTFEGCTSLQAIAMPSNLKDLGTRAFFGCTSLKYIVLNEGLENISEFAFTGCDSLESIIIPDSVRDIGRGAFSTGLTRKGNLWDTYSPERTEFANIQVTSTFELPSAGEIGDIRVFTDAEHYGEIWVRYDSGNNWELRDTIVGFELFYDVISPTSIESGKLFINSDDGDLLVEYNSKLNSITLPFVGGSLNGVGENIYSGALADDEKPDNSIGVDNDVYVDTEHSQIYRKINGEWISQLILTLEDGTVGYMTVGDTDPTGDAEYNYYINTDTGQYWFTETNEWGESKGFFTDIFNIFGYIFISAGSKQNQSAFNSNVPNTLKSVTILGGELMIDGAFKDCSSLESVFIPKTIECIFNEAFENCSSLKTVAFENGSVLEFISDEVFKNCTSLTSIVIPEQCLEIGNRTFENCTSLTYVYIPDSLEVIWSSAFKNCTSLKSIVLPNVMSLDVGCFEGCTSLASLTAPSLEPRTDVIWVNPIFNNVMTYGVSNPSAFNSSPYYVNTNTGDLFAWVGDSYTGSWVKFDNIMGPSGVITCGSAEPTGGNVGDIYVRIGRCVYYEKTSEGWEIAGKTTYMWLGYLFTNFHDLADNSVVPESLKVVVLTSDNKLFNRGYGHAFENCKSLELVVLPNMTTAIGEYAFAGCSSLKAFTVGENVRSIGDYAFKNVGLGWEEGGARYGHGAPILTPNSKNGNFYVDVNTGEIYTKQNGIWSKGKLKVTVGENLYDSPDNDFGEDGDFFIMRYSTYSNSLLIKVDGQWEDANAQCYFGNGAPDSIPYPSNGEIYFDIDTNDLYICYNDIWSKGKIDPYVVYDNVYNGYCFCIDTSYSTDIGYSAHSTCLTWEGGQVWYITTLCGNGDPNLVDGDKYVDVDSGDVYVYNNHSWTYSETVNLLIGHGGPSGGEVGSYYFDLDANKLYYKANDGISSFVVPETVNYIGFGAFEGCTSLQSMVLPFIGNCLNDGDAYSYGDTLYFAYIFGADRWNETLSSYDSKVPSSLKSVTFTSLNVISAGPGMSYSTVCNYAFAECSNLENIYITNNCALIGDYAFYGCSSLKSVVVPNDCISVGNYAFANCSSLKYVYLPDELTPPSFYPEVEINFGDCVFANCASLEALVFPTETNVLGHNALIGCTSLKTLSLPSTYIDLEELNGNGGDPAIEQNNDPDPNNPNDYDYNYWFNNITGDFFVNYKGTWFKLYTNTHRGEVKSGYGAPSSSGNLDDIYFNNGGSIKDVYVHDGNNWQLTFTMRFSYVPYYFGDDADLVPQSLKTVIVTAADGATPVTYAHMFKGCRYIENIILPDNATIIGNYAFADCSSLQNFKIGKNVKHIGDYAFKNVGLGWEGSDTRYGHGAPLIVPELYDGAFYIDINTGDVYVKQHNVWRKGKMTVTFSDDYPPDGVGQTGDFWATEASWSGYPGEPYYLNIFINSSWEDANTFIYKGHGVPEAATAVQNGWFYVDLDTEDLYISSAGNWVKGRFDPITVGNVGWYTYYGGSYSRDSEFYINTSYSSYVPWDRTSSEWSCLIFIRNIGGPMSSGSLGLETACAAGSPVVGDGEKYIDVDSGKVYVYQNNQWILDNSIGLLTGHGFPTTGELGNYYLDLDSYKVYYKAGEGMTSFVIPDRIESVGLGAFQGCSNLKSMTLPFTGAFYEPYYSDPMHFGYIFGAENAGETPLYVPASLESVTITKGAYDSYDDEYFIGDLSFALCSSLKTIKIPNNIVKIGWNAFRGCTSLGSYVIPKTVRSIDESAFEGCTSLTYLVFEEGSAVEYIDSWAFKDCSSLVSFIAPNDTVMMRRGVFQGCTSLETLVLNEVPYDSTILSLNNHHGAPTSSDGHEGNSYYRYWLDEDTGNFYFRYVGEDYGVYDEYYVDDWYLFLNILDDPSNHIYNQVSPNPTSPSEGDVWIGFIDEPGVGIRYRVYRNSSWITVDANTLWYRYLGFAFGGQDNSCLPASLKTVKITTGYSNLIDSFKDCKYLENIILADNTVSIGAHAFEGCDSLKSFIFSDSVETIGESAFANCKNLEIASFSDNSELVTIGDYAFKDCTGITSFTVPDTVSSIGFGAFKGCNNLTSITIPFVGANYLSVKPSCSYGNGAPNYSINSNIYLDVDGKKLYQKNNGVWSCISDSDPQIQNLLADSLFGTTLPDSLDSCFVNCETLDVYFPVPGLGLEFAGNLIEILDFDPSANSSFGYIFGAESVKQQSSYIPSSLDRIVLTNANGADRDTIPAYAFYSLGEIDNIILPQGYHVIGAQAFANCSFKTFAIPDSVTSVGVGAFAGCDNLQSMIIPSLEPDSPIRCFADLFMSSAYDRSFTGPTSLKKVIVTGGTSISEDAFGGCGFIEQIIIPNSIQTIGDNAFYRCVSLKDIVLPKGVLSIGEAAFYGCTSLNEIYISKNVTVIEKETFYNCTSLEWVDCEYGCDFSKIGDYAFYNCISLKQASLLNANNTGRLTIGSYAFYNCTSLYSRITLRGITNIDYQAFAFSGILEVVLVSYNSEMITVGRSAFKNCHKLEGFMIGDANGSIHISYEAFQNCISLESVMISKNANIDPRAFLNCPSLYTIYFGGSSFSEWTTFAENNLNNDGNEVLYNAVEAGTYTYSIARVFCYSANAPENLSTTDNGKYWRLVTDYDYYNPRIWYKS